MTTMAMAMTMTTTSNGKKNNVVDG